MSKECQFCRKLEINKMMENHFRKDGEEKILYEYTVAMVTRSWTKTKGKRRAGRTTDYRNQGIGYKLNYCPECGKKLTMTQAERYREWQQENEIYMSD